ncbi:MAG: thiamine-phosphate kinase [Phycisphaerales bacterium]
MREEQLLQQIAARSARITDWNAVLVGPGDDAAILRTPPNPPGPPSTTPPANAATLLITTDQLIEGRHIERAEHPDHDWIDRAARKAIARSISDIAAMGARPLAGVATGAIPRTPAWSNELANTLFERMKHWSEHFNTPLVGGDIATVDGPLMLTSTILGTPHPSRAPILRSTARIGDAVWVTGALGGSLASGRHWSFQPRIEEAAALCDHLTDKLHAMMDISDGLALDAARLARASRVRIRLFANDLPRHPGVDPDHGFTQALTDGEDYELLLTTDPACDAESLQRALAPLNTPITRIGIVEANKPDDRPIIIVDAHNNELTPERMGWEHD